MSDKVTAYGFGRFCVAYSHLLYMVEMVGLEPTTLVKQITPLSQLSYIPS